MTSIAAVSHTVLILDHSFEPESVFVEPGDTVLWLHQDGAAHTVTGTGTETFDSEYMEWGDVYVRVFVNDGIHDYACLYHPMYGKVIVGGSTAINRGVPGAVEAAGRLGDSKLRDERDALGRKAGPKPSPYEAVIRNSPRP